MTQDHIINLRKGDVLVLAWAGPADTEDLARVSLNVDETDEVEIFPVSRIEPIGLSAYLADGHGIDPRELERASDKLGSLAGTIVVVSARAFDAGSGKIEVKHPLSLVARFREAEAEIGAPLPIETESAKGNLGGGSPKKPMSDARIGGMVAMAVLLFLAVFVVVFVLSAG